MFRLFIFSAVLVSVPQLLTAGAAFDKSSVVSLGVSDYPSYIQLDREGKILRNDAVSPTASLRQFKFERICQALHP